MKKLIICFGDSWTGGHFLNPDVEYFHLLHENNKEYCISRTWVRHLQNISNIKTINLGQPACSNDTIIYNIDTKLTELIQGYKPEEVLCIVGWSSPERRDFILNSKQESSTFTLLPAEQTDNPQTFIDSYGSFDGKKFWDFYRTYLYYFWCPEEYIIRHRNNVVLANSIFDSLKLDVLYFNAFYEISGFADKEVMLSDYQLAEQGELGKQYSSIYDNKFLNYTFREFLENKNDSTLFEKDDYHPTEKGHKLWAEHLLEVINDRTKI